jgi:hypothetical protein
MTVTAIQIEDSLLMWLKNTNAVFITAQGQLKSRGYRRYVEENPHFVKTAWLFAIQCRKSEVGFTLKTLSMVNTSEHLGATNYCNFKIALITFLNLLGPKMLWPNLWSLSSLDNLPSHSPTYVPWQFRLSNSVEALVSVYLRQLFYWAGRSQWSRTQWICHAGFQVTSL